MESLKTNHFARVVKLITGENILCLFADFKNEQDELLGYRLIYPFVLSLGETQENGAITIHYTRWCPYSPQEEHKIGGDKIISVVYPDNEILDNYVGKLTGLGVRMEDIFFEPQQPSVETPEVTQEEFVEETADV